MTSSMRIWRIVYTLAVVALVGWSLAGIQNSTPPNTKESGEILRQMLLTPKLSYLPDVLTGLRESIQIAALGTAIAAVLALPFGVLAARNLARLAALPFVGKLLLNAIRTFPEILLAIAFIKSVGPGPFAGVLAIAIHSIGMVGKLYAERIETVDKGALEALAATGASPVEIFRNGIIPEVLPDFLSFALYRFDLNVRSASVLGLVGAGGIGTLLQIQRLGGNWPEIGMIVIGIVATVLLVDFFSAKLRAKLT
jgi:phosphonate transport system permease protein